MATKAREGSILAIMVDEATRSIVFNVRGAGPEGATRTVTLDLERVHTSNIDYAALHGFKQRLGDMAALSRNPDTGLPATPADKFEAIMRGVEHYHSGTPDWNLRATGEGRTSGELAMLTRAVMEAKKMDAADAEQFVKVKDWLKSKTEGERKAIGVSAAIKPIMDRMRAEVAAPVDAEGLLAELA